MFREAMQLGAGCFLFTLVFAQSASANVTAVDVSGPKRIFDETVDQGTASGPDTYVTENFIWQNVALSKDVSESGLMVQLSAGSHSFTSDGVLFGDLQHSGGFLNRKMNFNIFGRDPAKTYEISATQYFDITEAKHLPIDYKSSTVMDLACINHNWNPKLIVRTFTPFFGSPGKVHSGKSITNILVIPPGICPENQFFVTFYVSESDAITISNFELGVSERKPI